MEKKKIAIVGSCVSRELFNVSLLQNVFDITSYFFQPCFWDLFGETFDVTKEEVYSLKTEDFTARTFWYYLTKQVLDEITINKPDYIIVDIDNIRSNVYKLTLNNKVIYLQGTGQSISRYIDFIEKSNTAILKQIEFEMIPFKEIDEKVIFSGLDKFILWLKNNFDEEKIIINHTQLSKNYFDINSQLQDYKNQKDLCEYQNIINKYHNYLVAKLPKSKKLMLVDGVCSMYGDYDAYQKYIPPVDHYIHTSYQQKAKRLLSLLSLNYEDFNPISNKDIKIDDLGFDFILQQNKFTRLNQRYKNLKSYVLDFNNYFDKIENIRKFIIVISSNGDCSKNIKYFRRKSLINLKMEINSPHYIAVSDCDSGFVYEEQNESGVEYVYNSEGGTIFVSSKNVEKNTHSSIKINGKEFSPNKEGLNVVVVNKKTFEIVDILSSNLVKDPDLLVSSKLFDSIKIK